MLSAALAALAVIIGAFGAHALHDILEKNGRSDTFETASKYHMYHSLALVLVYILSHIKPQMKLQVSGWLFAVGILIFSGSLYTLAITGITWLGAITPIGGLCFILAWIWLCYQAR